MMTKLYMKWVANILLFIADVLVSNKITGTSEDTRIDNKLQMYREDIKLILGSDE